MVERNFSSSEVMTMFGSLKNDIAIIAEGQGSLSQAVSVLKTDVSEIRKKLISVEDTIRLSLPNIFSRFSKLEFKASL